METFHFDYKGNDRMQMKRCKGKGVGSFCTLWVQYPPDPPKYLAIWKLRELGYFRFLWQFHYVGRAD